MSVSRVIKPSGARLFDNIGLIRISKNTFIRYLIFDLKSLIRQGYPLHVYMLIGAAIIILVMGLLFIFFWRLVNFFGKIESIFSCKLGPIID